MIEDEKSLIQPEEFRKMFFTFFKGEQKAHILYDKLIPHVSVFNIGDLVFDDPSEMTSSDQLIEAQKMVSVQKLSKFIDGFNFYPLKVCSIRQKNDSNEMTYIMSSNTVGSLAEKAKPETLWQNKPEAERRLLKLLSLVSYKINERFKNLRSAFRYIDTDHSQSISINEFAQAIDYFRLKISFEDMTKLYRYMDRDGSGEIGYDEFTLLSEERWRNIDPYKQLQSGITNHKKFMVTSSSFESRETNSGAGALGIKSNDAFGYQQLETMAKNHLKIPIR
jgi:Ca2+-binding EF-hand superfamily protein